MVCQKLICDLTLKWTKQKDAMWISFNHKVHSPATEITHAIKENYGLLISSLHNKVVGDQLRYRG